MNEDDISEAIKRARNLAHNKVFNRERIPKVELRHDEEWLDRHIPDAKRKLLANNMLHYAAKLFSEMFDKLRVDCRSCKWNGTLDAEGKKKRAENSRPMCPYPKIRGDTRWCPLYSPVNEGAIKMFDEMGMDRKKLKDAFDILNNASKEYWQAHSKTTNKGG